MGLFDAKGPGERTGDSSIHVDHLSKHFNLRTEGASSLKERITSGRKAKREEFWALSDVTFDVPAGSMWALVGHNGSGKSTLLRCIAGIYRPSSGSVDVSGRMSALLELGSGFHPDLTGRENVYLNAAILGLTKHEVDARMGRIIDFADIGEFIDAPVRVYSSGMYVRLGFAIAVNIDPEVLLIDEVIAVGDEAFQRKCFEYLYELRKGGATVVVVSHSLSIVETMCDGAVWLAGGEVQQVGDTSAVVSSYLDRVNAAEDSHAGVGDSAVEHHGSGEMEITGVGLVDGEGADAPSLICGRPGVIRFDYRTTKPITRPVLSFSVHHESGTHVADTSTWLEGRDLGTVSGSGHIDWAIDSVPLAPGTYELTVAVRDEHNQHFYDRVDKGYRLVVRQGDRPIVAGLIDLAGSWGAATGGGASP
ncbi:MAG: ABC transporter ATP-binding protein [Microthrixaceae bacterium]